MDPYKKGKTRIGIVTRATIDSGACTTIAPPSAFPNTDMFWTSRVGKVYGACGGESVKNIGTKSVEFETENHKTEHIDFDIGDKITKPLIAVSNLAEKGKAVFLVPPPSMNHISFMTLMPFVATRWSI